MIIETIRSFLEARPMGVFVLLSSVVGGVYALSETRTFKKIFNILPCVFWVYFLPMVLATLNIFPSKSPVYDILKDYFLPASLFLLFISTNISDILKLGPRTLLVMVSGSVGVVIGSVVGVLVLIPFFKAGLLPENHLDILWKGVAALSGSWIGGSANMAAIWESLVSKPPTPAEGGLFSAMIAVDICVAYPWMALVIALAAYQTRVDRWTKADTSQVEKVNKRMEEISKSESRFLRTDKFIYMLALAFFAALLSNWLGFKIEKIFEGVVKSQLWRSILGSYAVMIILITFFGLSCSFTPISKLEGYGASKVGYALLYLVLARIGAKSNLNALTNFPWYILMGVVWILIHALCLFIAMRIMRAPMFFAATASQANIGGPVSAPVVAAAYQPNLAVVGLLMAIVGNILGTFLGLFAVAPIIQFLTSLFH